MPSQEEVEQYKITPEMKKFAKTYRKFNDIGSRLRGKLQIQLDEASQTRNMLGQVEKGMQLLLQSSPQKPTFEVPGQGEGEEMPEEQGQMEQGGMGQEQQTMNPQINY